MPFTVKIIGNGNAGKKQRAALETLPSMFKILNDGDRDAPDIATICTPNYAHAGNAIEHLCTHHTHVIIEKPICVSLNLIDCLIRMAAHAQRTVFPIFQYRFTQHDEIGARDFFGIEIVRDSNYYSGWRGQSQYALGGSLLSHGIHLIDLIMKERGMPIAVTMLDRPRHGTTIEVEQNINVILKFNTEPHEVQISIQIYKDKTDPDNAALQTFNFGNSHQGYIIQFIGIHEAITADPIPTLIGLPTLAEARQSMEVITALYYAAMTKEWVSLPLLDDHPFHRGWQQFFEQRRQHIQAFQKTHESPDHPAG